MSKCIFGKWEGFIRMRRRIYGDLQKLWFEEKYKLFLCKGRHDNKVLSSPPWLHFLLWKGVSDVTFPCPVHQSCLSIHFSHAPIISHILLSWQRNTLRLPQHNTLCFVVSQFPLLFTLFHRTGHQLFRHTEISVSLAPPLWNLWATLTRLTIWKPLPIIYLCNLPARAIWWNEFMVYKLQDFSGQSSSK